MSILALALSAEIEKGSDGSDILCAVVETVSDWIVKQFNSPINKGLHSKSETDYVINQVISIQEEQSLTNISWEHKDQLDETVVWQNQIRLLQTDPNKVCFELKIFMASRINNFLPPATAVQPTDLLLELAKTSPLTRQGETLVPKSLRLASTDDIDLFISALLSVRRKHPVILMSSDKSTSKFPYDADHLSEMLFGLANVYTIDTQTNIVDLSNRLGPSLDCDNGMTRIYYPGLSLQDSEETHPKVDTRGGDRFARRLYRTLAQTSALRYSPLDVFIDFDELTTSHHVNANDVSETSQQEELLHLEELLNLKTSQIQELTGQLEIEREQNDNLINHINNQEENVASILQHYETIQDEENNAFSMEIPINNVEDAVYMAAEEFESYESIIFADNAFASASNSPYMNPKKIYETLQVIATVAERYNSGETGPLSDKFSECGLSYASGISKTARQQFKGHYLFDYEGSNFMMGPHISLGTGSPDTCARIYFAKDTQQRRFIIGHVGQHLPDAHRF